MIGIDAGEKAAIQLASSLNADLLLMDDRKGVNAALRKGHRVTGTLGILDLAAQRGLVNLAQSVSRLRRTTFRIPEALLDSLMKTHAQRGGNAQAVSGQAETVSPKTILRDALPDGRASERLPRMNADQSISLSRR